MKPIEQMITLGVSPPLAEKLWEIFGAGNEPPEQDTANFHVLYFLKGADLTSTEDQAFTKVGDWSSGIVSQVHSVNASATPTGAAGGVYGATGKSSPTIVSSTQSWAGMPNSRRIVNAPLSANQMLINGEVYLSLTNPSSVPATADFYISGVSINEVS